MSANAEEQAPVGGLLNRSSLRVIVADLAQDPVPDGNQIRTAKMSDIFKQVREEAGIAPFPQDSDVWDVAAHQSIFMTLTSDTNLITINDDEPGLKCEGEFRQDALGNHKLTINGTEMAISGKGGSSTLVTGRRYQDELRFNQPGPLAGAKPEVIEQPIGITATIGTTAAFKAKAINWDDVSLIKNGVTVPDAHGTAYQVPISFESKGAYQFKFTNRYGFTLTDPANIDSTESDIPAIVSQPTDQTLDEGGSFSLPFIVSGPNLIFRVYKNNTLIATSSANVYTKVTAKVTDSGTYRIEAGNTLGQVVSNTVTVTVNAIVLPVPVINFTQPSGMTVGGIDQTLFASSTNTVTPIVFTSSDTTVATIVSGNKLRVIAPGTVDIIASQAAGNGFQQAVSVTRTVTMIAQPVAVISFAQPSDMTVGDADQTLSFSSTNAVTQVVLTSSNVNVAAIVSGKLRILAPGTVTITASQVAGNGYQAAQPVVWSVAMKALQVATISFTQPVDMAVGDADQALTASSNNAVTPITFASSNTAVATIVDGKLHIVAPGSVQITASQAAGNGFSAATSVIRSVTMSAAPVLTTINALTTDAFYNTKTYGSPAVNAFSEWRYNVSGTTKIKMNVLSNNFDASLKTGAFGVWFNGVLIGNYQGDAATPTDIDVPVTGSGLLVIRSGATQNNGEGTANGLVLSNKLNSVTTVGGSISKVAVTKKDTVVAVVGDSISVGLSAGVPALYGWVPLLKARRSTVDFVALGWGAKKAYATFTTTPASGQPGLTALITELHACLDGVVNQIIYIPLGVNDAISGSPSPDDVKAVYQSGINAIKAEFPNAKIIIQTPLRSDVYETNTALPSGFTLQQFRSALAGLTGVNSIVDGYPIIGSNSQVNDYADPVHPNAGGHVKIADAAESAIFSSVAAPTITTQPQAQTVNSGQPLTLSVVANGSGLGYQWQKLVSSSWVNVSGATAASFTINTTSTSDAGSYRVVVSNSGGSVTSSAAVVTVNAVSNPALLSALPSNLTYSAVFSGEKGNVNEVDNSTGIEAPGSYTVAPLTGTINGKKAWAFNAATPNALLVSPKNTATNLMFACVVKISAFDSNGGTLFMEEEGTGIRPFWSMAVGENSHVQNYGVKGTVALNQLTSCVYWVSSDGKGHVRYNGVTYESFVAGLLAPLKGLAATKYTVGATNQNDPQKYNLSGLLSGMVFSPGYHTEDDAIALEAGVRNYYGMPAITPPDNGGGSGGTGILSSLPSSLTYKAVYDPTTVNNQVTGSAGITAISGVTLPATSGAINGKPAWDFNAGTPNGFTAAFVNADNKPTVAMVVNLDTYDTAGGTWIMDGAGAFSSLYINGSAHIYSTTVPGAGLPTGQKSVVIYWVGADGVGHMRINGVNYNTSGNVSTFISANANMPIGYSTTNNPAKYNFDGQMGTLIISDTIKTDADVTTLENSLKAYFGLTF